MRGQVSNPLSFSGPGTWSQSSGRLSLSPIGSCSVTSSEAKSSSCVILSPWKWVADRDGPKIQPETESVASLSLEGPFIAWRGERCCVWLTVPCRLRGFSKQRSTFLLLERGLLPSWVSALVQARLPASWAPGWLHTLLESGLIIHFWVSGLCSHSDVVLHFSLIP